LSSSTLPKKKKQKLIFQRREIVYDLKLIVMLSAAKKNEVSMISGRHSRYVLSGNPGNLRILDFRRSTAGMTT
jgi:hypothetical protein